MKELYNKQISRLKEFHFLILFWVAKAESRGIKYNITHVYDDLKNAQITRTKQNAVSYIDSLSTLCLIDLIDEQNKKNLYITNYGAKALEIMVKKNLYAIKPSHYMENLS